MNPKQPHVVGGRVILLPDPPPSRVVIPHAFPVGAGFVIDEAVYEWNGTDYVLT